MPDAVAVEYWSDALVDAAIQRRGRRQLQELRDRSAKGHPRFADAMVVLRYWQSTCRPKAKELEGERLRLCLDRLDGGSTVEQLKLACYGYSLKPFVVHGRRTHQGPRDSWYADATLIFRDETHVAAGIDIAKRAGELESVFRGEPSSDGHALSPLGRAALKVAKTFPVFPVRPADKVPATKHGFKDAKQDPDAIRRYWAANPDCNIGVPTGKVSGVVVVDVDGEFGWESLRDLEDEHDTLPETLSVKTPRGGEHLWFLHPGDREVPNSASLLGPALDIRGDGGYVLAPPSVGANGNRYEIDDEVPMTHMPAWLLELIEKRQSRIHEAFRTGDYKALFEGADPGTRNDRLFRLACSLVRKLDVVTARGLVHAANKAYCNPVLDDREVDQVVKSALKMKDKPE